MSSSNAPTSSSFPAGPSPPHHIFLPIRPTPPAAAPTSTPTVQSCETATQTPALPPPPSPQPVRRPPQPYYAADVLAQIALIPTLADSPTLAGPSTPAYIPTPAIVLTLPSEAPMTSMLRVSAINSLFQENLTEDAKSIILTTTHGTLLGASQLPPSLCRKACALGTLTWRVAAALLAGQDPASLSTSKPLTTLAQKTKREGRALATLVLVLAFEGGVLVLAHMKENLLVGVLGGPCGVDGEKVESEEKEKGKGKEGEEGDGGVGDEGTVGEGGVGEEAGEGAGGEDGETAWKGAEALAEAMAAYLRVEMAEFTMPQGFE